MDCGGCETDFFFYQQALAREQQQHEKQEQSPYLALQLARVHPPGLQHLQRQIALHAATITHSRQGSQSAILREKSKDAGQ
jgi:hypothetical protein